MPAIKPQIKPLFIHNTVSIVLAYFNCHTYIIVIMHPWDLYLICKCDAWGCSLWAECLQIRYIPNGCFTTAFFYSAWVNQRYPWLCLAWRTILYCWSCATERCGWFSWWTALDIHAFKLKWIYHTNLHNHPYIRILYKCTFEATISWLLVLYAWSTLWIMAKSHVYGFAMIIW